MGVESFHYRKPALSVGENIQLVGQMYGTLVDSTQRANAPGDNIQPAGLYSTAPYTGPNADDEPPVRRSREPEIRRVGDGVRIVKGKPRCKANNDTCMGLAFNHEFCLGHRRAIEKAKKVESSTSKD